MISNLFFRCVPLEQPFGQLYSTLCDFHDTVVLYYYYLLFPFPLIFLMFFFRLVLFPPFSLLK